MVEILDQNVFQDGQIGDEVVDEAHLEVSGDGNVGLAGFCVGHVDEFPHGLGFEGHVVERGEVGVSQVEDFFRAEEEDFGNEGVDYVRDEEYGEKEEDGEVSGEFHGRGRKFANFI